jgi:cytochrome b561
LTYRENSIAPEHRYTTGAIILHWAIAALILLNIGIGLVMESLDKPLKEIFVPLHFSCGMTVLALSILRIIWRLTHRPPSFHPGLLPWERAAAHTVHALLYVAMTVMPLIGWMIISAHPPRPQGAAMIWGLIRLPAISPISHLAQVPQKQAHGLFVDAHSIGAWILIGLLVLHIAGALKHQWIDRHPELSRMGLGRSSRRKPAAAQPSSR